MTTCTLQPYQLAASLFLYQIASEFPRDITLGQSSWMLAAFGVDVMHDSKLLAATMEATPETFMDNGVLQRLIRTLFKQANLEEQLMEQLEPSHYRAFIEVGLGCAHDSEFASAIVDLYGKGIL